MDREPTGEDFIDFKCPHCGSLNSFSTSAANCVHECINCLDLLIVPAQDGEAARKLPFPIEAPRLRLRPFEPTDWQDLLEFQFEDEDEATGWIPTTSTIRTGDMRGPFYLAVELLETNKVVGSLGFTFLDPELNQVELSLTSKTPASLPGLELEVFEAALDFCFQEMNLHRVITRCGADDSEQRELFKSLGMRQEAEFRKHQHIGGQWLSTAYFAILEEEYFSEQSS
ncbi:MAG TPA: GNAT family protein [Candidatus Angelobacter sp.]|nr:GNAT family protein [Candidatus Angelobacter sp.]